MEIRPVRTRERKLRFTKTALLAIRPPSSGYIFAWDEHTPGLGLRVTASGAKSFIYQRRIKGRSRRITLDRFPRMTVDNARRQADKLAAKIADDRDPVEERRREEAEGVALETALEAYLRARRLKARTKDDVRYCLAAYLKDWLPRPVREITPAMVEKRHREIGERSEAQSNLTLRYLRAVLNFAAAKWAAPDGTPLLVYNPVRRLSDTRSWYRVERRRTLLKEYEIKPWWAAVEALGSDPNYASGPEYRDYFKLLLLTGLRRSEALKLEWADLDMQGRTLTVRDTKNREPHTLPLTDYLLDLLRERLERAHGKSVFCGPSGKRISNLRYAEDYVTRQSGGIAVTPHDLRRTFATIAERLDVPGYAVKRLLNHVQRGDVTAGYLVIDVERLREPMERISAFVLKAAGLREGATVKTLAV